MITRRSWLVYGTLLAIWVALIGWQGVEHFRVRRYLQQKLVDRTKDISNTLGLLLRSKSFFGRISQDRLESALNELIKPSEFHPLSVEVVNMDYEKIAGGAAHRVAARRASGRGLLGQQGANADAAEPG